jgi:hypothetical protein
MRHDNQTQPKRGFLTARTLVVGQFITVVVILGAGTVLATLVGHGVDSMLIFFGLPLLLVSTITVLSWAVWRPNRGKLTVALLALATVVALDAATPHLARAGTRLFFETHREQLDVFTRDVLEFGRIRAMSDGLRHFKELNGELVAYTSAEVDTTVNPEFPEYRPTLPLTQVLTRDGIEHSKYEEFRTRLHELELIGLEVHPGFVAYLYDGMLDNLVGYLYVPDGGEAPALRSEVFTTILVALRPLGNGWYWFATT